MPHSAAPVGAEQEEIRCDGSREIEIPFKGLSEGKAWNRFAKAGCAIFFGHLSWGPRNTAVHVGA